MKILWISVAYMVAIIGNLGTPATVPNDRTTMITADPNWSEWNNSSHSRDMILETENAPEDVENDAAVLELREDCGLGVHGDITLEATKDLPSVTFPHTEILDGWESYVLSWSPEVDGITFEIQVKTQGYVGFGFSIHGGMINSDIVMGWVDEDDIVHFQDRFAYGYETPVVDRSQNYQLLGGYQNESHTVIRFYRPWETCDVHNDMKIPEDGVARIIWSYDINDPINLDHMQRHRFRGAKTLNLLGSQHSDPLLTEDVKFFDIRSENVNLPNDTISLYMCRIVKLPDLARKAHMIGYQSVIQKGNEQLVHHIAVNECQLDNTELIFEQFVDRPGVQCYSEDLPKEWMICNTPIIIWSTGSDGIMYPEHVGLPLGEEIGGASYFMLNIHFNNPSLLKGIKDNSGMRVFYTHERRPNEAGMFKIGHSISPTVILPPGQQQWPIIGHCSSECTSKGIPNNGINVFQGLLHGHGFTTAVSVRQFRNGEQLPFTFEDLAYEYRLQHPVILDREMVILPGDDILIQCRYNTTGKQKPVFGGLATDEEMCILYATYYPRVNFTGCFSQPDVRAVLAAIGAEEQYNKSIVKAISEADADGINLLASKMNQEMKGTEVHLSDLYKALVIKAPPKYTNRTVYDVLNDDDTWRNETILSTFQSEVVHGFHHPECKRPGRIPLEQIPKLIEYPESFSHGKKEES